MKLKKANKIVSILVTLCMLLTMVAPAFAGDSGATIVTKTKTGDEKTIGKLLIAESVQGKVYDNKNTTYYVTVELPSGVEFSDGNVIDADNISAPSYVGDFQNAFNNSTVDNAVQVENQGDTYVTFKIKGGDYVSSTGKAGFEVDFGLVDISSSAAGDIKVNVKAEGTPFESGEFLVSRAAEGSTTVTAGEAKTIGRDAEFAAQIKVEENATSTFENGDEIKVVLPKDIDWAAGTKISTVGVSVEGVSGSLTLTTSNIDNFVDGDTLTLKVNGQSSDVPGFVTITPKIDAEDDFEAGDVEATVKGDHINSTDVVIAKIADYDVDVYLDDNDVKQVVAGVDDNEIDQIDVEETVPKSFVDGRTVTLTLPSYAHFTQMPDEGSYTEGGLTYTISYDKTDTIRVNGTAGDYPRKMTIRATGNTGSDNEKIELDNLEIAVDADAPAGDLAMEIAGTLGVEKELVVAKVVTPITVTGENKDVKIGVQNQSIGDITIKENVEGAITKDGQYLYIKAPEGVTFTEVPKVEVTAGNFEVDTIKFADANDDVLQIEVDSESTKEPSTIVLKDVKVNVDRTVAVGAMKFSVYGRAIDEVSETDSDVEDNAIKFTAGNVVTPAGAVSAVFNIGSGIYTVNGVAQVMDAAPYIKDGRTYVPVRYLAYALGVSEDNIGFENGVVTLTKGATVVKLTIGSTALDVNGTASTMDVAPEINNGRTMLPARFVAEAFGATVGYANGQVVINQ